ncbi:MAG: DinB family protein [Planctomycetes bacterium]|nr:DinB family protein [Planctomycetota bacterium]
MNAIENLLFHFDANLNHPWESLEAALKGVTDDEARWQAPCYAGEKTEEDGSKPGTILWQMDHISGCNRLYAAVLRQRPAKEIEEPQSLPPSKTFADALEELRASHAALRAEVAKLKDTDLQSPCGHGCKSVAEFLAACLRHEIWHASQISVARRLYRTRP